MKINFSIDHLHPILIYTGICYWCKKKFKCNAKNCDNCQSEECLEKRKSNDKTFFDGTRYN